MIITADIDTSAELVNRLTNGTQQASPLEHGVKRKEIDWIDDVVTLLEPIRKKFAVFQVDVFQGDKNQTNNFNRTFSIPTEGVYSTYFLFGPHKPVETPDKESDVVEDFLDDIFGDDSPQS